MPRIKEFESDALGSVWVDCPHHPEAIASVEKLLGTELRPHHNGEGHISGRAPSYVVFCPDGEGLVPGLKRLRALAPEAPILVFGPSLDLRLARAALRAGAQGFVHAGMEPGQVVRAVSADPRERYLLPRALLENLLERKEEIEEGQARSLVDLPPCEREILGLVAEGFNARQAAWCVRLPEREIKRRLRKAFEALGVRDRREAAEVVRVHARFDGSRRAQVQREL